MVMEEEEEEEEVWPPVWKTVEKSPQYYLIDVYFLFGVDDFADAHPPGAEGHELKKRFLQQVRESRGYDLDCPPRFLNSAFYPRPLKSVMNCEVMSVMVKAQMKFVIGKVNAQAERHGEKYVLDKLKKVVDVTEYRTNLLTFTVKQVVPNPNLVKTIQAMVFHARNAGFELKEWRFKPQVSEEEEVLPTVSEEEEVLPPVLEDEELEEEEREVWPPVWKSVKKSPQYRFIDVYFLLEVDDFAGKYPPGSEGHELIKRFFRQVRESRGYDVDCHPPSFLYSPFCPLSIESVMNNEELSASVEARVKFVTAEINAEAGRHGEAYVLEKLEKVVDVGQYRTYCLLTFTVKEVVPNPNVVKTVQAMVFAGTDGFRLQDWRFKPQEAIITSSCAASREGIIASRSITS